MTILSQPTNPSIDPLGGGFMEAYEPSNFQIDRSAYGTPGSFASERNNLEAGLGSSPPIWKIRGLTLDQTEIGFNQQVGGFGNAAMSFPLLLVAIVAGGLILQLITKNKLV